MRSRLIKGSSNMTQYCAYIIGSDGEFQNSVSLECADDEVAVKRAKQLVGGHHIELWQRSLRSPITRSAYSRHDRVRRNGLPERITPNAISRGGITGYAEQKTSGSEGAAGKSNRLQNAFMSEGSQAWGWKTSSIASINASSQTVSGSADSCARPM